MFYEEELIKEEIASIVNALLMLKVRSEGEKVYEKIYKNITKIIDNVLEKGFVEEEDALSIFGYIAY